MGWDVGAGGLKIVLDADGARRSCATTSATTSTASSPTTGSTRADIGCYVAHPGGPKVLEAMADALGVGREALQRHLGLAGRDRQPVVGLGAARAAPTPCATTRRGPAPTGCCWRWARASAPSSCCCGPDAMSLEVLFTVAGRSLVGLERLAELVVSKRNAALALRARRRRDRARALPVHGRAAHRPAGRLRSSRCGSPHRPVRAALGVADARARRRQPGAALVVHHDARAALEHPRHRRARACRRSTGGPYRCLSAPQLRRRRRRGRRAAAGAAARGSPRSSSPSLNAGAARRADPRRERRRWPGCRPAA